jgi:hypothetical protein
MRPQRLVEVPVGLRAVRPEGAYRDVVGLDPVGAQQLARRWDLIDQGSDDAREHGQRYVLLDLRSAARGLTIVAMDGLPLRLGRRAR